MAPTRSPVPCNPDIDQVEGFVEMVHSMQECTDPFYCTGLVRMIAAFEHTDLLTSCTPMDILETVCAKRRNTFDCYRKPSEEILEKVCMRNDDGILDATEQECTTKISDLTLSGLYATLGPSDIACQLRTDYCLKKFRDVIPFLRAGPSGQ